MEETLGGAAPRSSHSKLHETHVPATRDKDRRVDRLRRLRLVLKRVVFGTEQ